MSNVVFPALPGITWDCLKTPTFNNFTHSPVTGRDIRIALYNEPIFEFTLTCEFMDKADRDALLGFYLARRGSFDSFLYADEDTTVVDHWFGVADGTSTDYQLKLVGVDDTEQTINNPDPGIVVTSFAGEVETTIGYTISATGLVMFDEPPNAGDDLYWSGAAYYRCIFMEDQQEYNQFMYRLYECSEIYFKGSLANKL